VLHPRGRISGNFPCVNTRDRNDNESGSGQQPLRRLFLRTLAMLLLGGALVLATTLVGALPCWGVFILTGLLAWPIWLHRTEYRLFHRRLLLESVIRPLLWKGTFVNAVNSAVIKGGVFCIGRNSCCANFRKTEPQLRMLQSGTMHSRHCQEVALHLMLD
jgi:hypothetical protein